MTMIASASRWLAPLALVLALISGPLAVPALAGPEGAMTWGVHVSSRPRGSTPPKPRASSLLSCFSTRCTTPW